MRASAGSYRSDGRARFSPSRDPARATPRNARSPTHRWSSGCASSRLSTRATGTDAFASSWGVTGTVRAWTAPTASGVRRAFRCRASALVGDRVFTGDALLIRAAGRTDFQSGNAGQLYDTITGVLFALPDATLVFPAHDYRGRTVTTVAEEKRWNTRIAGRSRDAFIDHMSSLGLPPPKLLRHAPRAPHRGLSRPARRRGLDPRGTAPRLCRRHRTARCGRDVALRGRPRERRGHDPACPLGPRSVPRWPSLRRCVDGGCVRGPPRSDRCLA